MDDRDIENTLDQAKRYSRLKYGLIVIDTIYLLLLLFLFQGLGLSKTLAVYLSRLTANTHLTVLTYLLIAYALYSLLDLPLTFYSSFVVEHKFGLSKQKMREWFKDHFKAGVISYLILAVLFMAFYQIIRYNPSSWWLIISAFWIFFSLVLARLVPVMVIPVFFKYKPLSDEKLKIRVRVLADKMKVKILDVFEIDLSKKTLKANAAFIGWGKTRRVILGDTLKDKYSHDEIEIILAHEFAHYKLNHLIKLLAINSLATILSFYAIFKSQGYVLKLFGLPSLSDIASFPVILMYLIVLGTAMQPFTHFISRVLEREADITALKVTGAKESFVSMMEKLARQNLADRNPHRIIKLFFFDHPPIDERIALAK
jgi:STE24 endopeptidase